MKTFLSSIVTLGMMGGFLWAEPKENQDPKPIEGMVENGEWIKAHMNQEVILTGVPNAKSNTSAAGHYFYNFDRSDLTIFCFKAVATTLPDEKKPAALVGKTIRVSGKLVLYKEKPQIVIRKPEQIQIVEAAAPSEEKK